MLDKQFKLQLKTACKLFGGQKAVATTAEIDNSNFGKWLNGKPTLSPENIDSVLHAMGLPNAIPDTSRVHIWGVHKISGIDFAAALKLYFPNGGTVARTSMPYPIWSSESPYRNIAFIYAMTDGHVRAVMRHTVKDRDERNALLKSHLEWRNGSHESMPLRILESFKKWTAGTISPIEFDFVWENIGLSPDMQSIITHVEAAGMDPQEAERRLDIDLSAMDLTRLNRNDQMLHRHCMESIAGRRRFDKRAFHDFIIPAYCCYLAKKGKGIAWIKRQGWDTSEAEWVFGPNWLDIDDDELEKHFQ